MGVGAESDCESDPEEDIVPSSAAVPVQLMMDEQPVHATTVDELNDYLKHHADEDKEAAATILEDGDDDMDEVYDVIEDIGGGREVPVSARIARTSMLCI